MFGIFSKLQNTLEALDDQAAASAGQQNNTNRFDLLNNERQSDDLSDEIKTPEDYESLLSSIQRYKMQISNFEEQIKLLTQENAKLKTELEEAEMTASNLRDDFADSERQKNSLKLELSSLEKKQQNDNENFEKMKQNMEELRTKLEKDLTSITEQNTNLQHELQIKESENTKLNEKMQSQETEIKTLEQDIAKYREKAVKTLTEDQFTSSTISGQLELLENERNRLKERYSRAQQKISQLETAAKEIEEQMHNEIGEVKMQQVSLENELFREKTQNEALTHELSLVRSQLFASREQAESRFKAQLQAERTEHKAEIARIREEQNKKTSHSSEQKLIEMNAMIENLKSEKATLMLMLENKKTQKDDGLRLGVGIAKRNRKTSRSLSSLLPYNAPNFISNTTQFIDKKLDSLRNFFYEKPLYLLLFAIWFVIANLLWLFK